MNTPTVTEAVMATVNLCLHFGSRTAKDMIDWFEADEAVGITDQTLRFELHFEVTLSEALWAIDKLALIHAYNRNKQ